MRIVIAVVLGAAASASLLAGPVVYSNYATFTSVMSVGGVNSTVRTDHAPIGPRFAAAGMRIESTQDIAVRTVSILSTVIAPESLGAMRVSIYESVADFIGGATLFRADFNPGDLMVEDFSNPNIALTNITFDLGLTLDLAAGEWIIEIAQIEPISPLEFWAISAPGEGLHTRNGGGLSGVYPSLASVELRGADASLIPLPTAGTLGLMGLTAVVARRRRA